MALKAGHADEAIRILERESVRDFLPAKRLTHEVAQHLVSRSEQHLQQGDSIASWADLQQAARLGASEQRVAELRHAQTQRSFDRVRKFLLQGDTQLAADEITRLQQRHLGGSERRAWKLIVHWIATAKALAERGETAAARELLEQATRTLPDPHDEVAQLLAARQAELHLHAQELTRLTNQLHASLTKEAWSEVLTIAGTMLELAPGHNAARRARRRAWEAVGIAATQAFPPREQQRVFRSVQRTHVWTRAARANTWPMHQQSNNAERGKRMVAWIDGVGGYLICTGDELVLGQPAGGGADIPILADLSRRHATIRREGEAYVLTPIHSVRVDGVELAGPQVLKDNALVELGGTVRVRFRKPHALSGTGVLTLESNHKTEPAVDGIVLMSESCVLGSKSQSHILCRDWTDDLVLFRRGEDLQFRSASGVQVNGKSTTSGSVIADNTRIEGENFSLSFEEIDTWS